MVSRGPDDQSVRINAVSFETVVADFPLIFPAPFAELTGCRSYEYTWHLLTYVFRLPDPKHFPPLVGVLEPDELQVLRRYVTSARELAQSAFLQHPIRFEFSWNGELHEHVDTQFPPSENIRGFSVLFRQFYENSERASFQNVQRVLREANSRSNHSDSESRSEILTSWGKAVGRLRRYMLTVCVAQRLHSEGRMHPPPYPGSDTNPAQLISIYNYGNDIHWGRRSDDLAAIEVDEFTEKWTRMSFFDCVGGLAHVFMGMAQLVDAAGELGVLGSGN